MWIDLINTAIAVATLAVTLVIYSLGRRIGLRATMEGRATVADELTQFNRRIYVDGENSSLLLMNAARYARGDYTAYQNGGGTGLSWRGDLVVGGEFVGLRHDGFEFLSGRSAKGHPDSLEILFVPFDRVQWVNLDGDENFNRLIVYVSFEGPFPTPQAYSYPADRHSYKLREKSRIYYRRIDGAKLTRSTGLQALWAAPMQWLRAIQFDQRDRRSTRNFARAARR